MSDALHAIEISGVIMLSIVAFITLITSLAVKRGEARRSVMSLEAGARTNAVVDRLMTRRSLISWLGLAWMAFSASVLAGATATGRFMFPNVLFEPPATFKAGFPNEIQPGEVDTRFKSQYGVWLVRDVDPVTGEKGIAALSDICTHLGCIPNWLEDAQKFKCPCHGSGYYKNGINFEGPTPRPLERFAISLADDGQIFVDKNQKFQYEKGQWSDPRSFLKLS